MTTTNPVEQDARFQEILRLEGIDLQEFYQDPPVVDLFPNAQTYPEFFNENLVSPNRVLKQFVNNPQSNIRIFYYQILRLGYEVEPQSGNNRVFILNLKRIVFHPDFEILFTPDTEEERDLFNDFQFKKLFAEFIVLLDKQEFPEVEQILSHYPIMDTVFIHIFRSLLASQNINEEFDRKIQSEVVFVELSNVLELNIASYGNCWKFEDSDMFCYEENENQLYLAFILDDGQGADLEEDQAQQQPFEVQDSNGYLVNRIHPDATIADSNIIPPPQPPIRQGYEANYTPSYQPQPPRQDPYPMMDNRYNPNSAAGSFSPQQKPNASMISENYQFTDYLGVTTTQKYRGPRQKDDPSQGLAKNYDGFLNKVENTIKSSLTYNNVPFDYQANDYKPTDYFSGSYQVNRSENPKPYEPQPSYPTYQSDSYQSSHNHLSYDSNPTYKSEFKLVQPTQLPIQTYKPMESQVTAFHSATHTPFPNYASNPIPKPSTSYDSYDNNPYAYSVPSTTMSKDYTSSYSYKQPYDTTSAGDYYKDFTPPDILSKLRLQNRQNIHKIREAMKGLSRNADLPPDFDVRKSAIYNNALPSQPKEDLFRNQSRSQFQYTESYKKPLTAEVGMYNNRGYQDYNSNYQNILY